MPPIVDLILETSAYDAGTDVARKKTVADRVLESATPEENPELYNAGVEARRRAWDEHIEWAQAERAKLKTVAAPAQPKEPLEGPESVAGNDTPPTSLERD